MTSRSVDPLDVIEAAYRLDLPDPAWIEGLLERTAPALDAAHGVLAFLYDAAARPLEVSDFVGVYPPTREELLDVVTSANDELVAQTYLVIPFGNASEAPGFDRQRKFSRRLHKYGIYDVLGLNAFDRSGVGAWIGALLPKKATLEREDRERWTKVSRHIAAALRLRRRLGPPKTQMADTSLEAVLSTAGKLEHATDAVAGDRLNLTEAVRRLDHARGRLRKTDPEAAVDAWKVLVSARWSLVDQLESDGKRYILAYRNAPGASGGPESFTEREREIVDLVLLGHAPKMIAYELGLAPSTVRVHLTNASRKLKVRSRDELVTAYRAWLFQQSP